MRKKWASAIQWLLTKDHPFKDFDESVIIPVLEQYLDDLVDWQHPATILAEMLDDEIEIRALRELMQGRMAG